LKGSGRCLTEVLPQNLPGQNEEGDEKPLSGKLVFQSSFEPRIFQIQAQRLTLLHPSQQGIVELIICACSIRNVRPPLWSSGQSSLLQIQRFRVRFLAPTDFLRGSGSGTGSTQPREYN
jgi:hypothetical protein